MTACSDTVDFHGDNTWEKSIFYEYKLHYDAKSLHTY